MDKQMIKQMAFSHNKQLKSYIYLTAKETHILIIVCFV